MMRLLKRWWWIALAVPLIIGLARVEFDVEVLNLLPDEVEEVQGLKLYQEHFTNDRELLITVRGPNADSAQAAAAIIADCLRERTNLTSSVAWQPPWQEHPEQMGEIVAALWLNQPPEQFAKLTNRLAPENLDDVLADTREQLTTSLSPMVLGQLAYDPFGLTRLLDDSEFGGFATGEPQDWFSSPDGLLRVVYVEGPQSIGDYRNATGWLAKVESEIAECRTHDDWPGEITVRFTGAPALMTDFAAGMERDVKRSVAFSLILVAGLFWWAHRSLVPLLWLSVFLVLIVTGTLAAAGFMWGKVNAVSLGFAAILLGLSVDYAMVLYQEAVSAPHLNARQIRHLLWPSIFWAAFTTAAAFCMLTLAGLPGLAQLGSLVATGILLAAVVMMFGFLPVVLRHRVEGRLAAAEAHSGAKNPRTPAGTLTLTAIIALAALGIFAWKGWQVEHGTKPLEPRNSAAHNALEELDREMNRQGEPLMLLASGDTAGDVARRLETIEERLQQAKSAGHIRNYSLPTDLWPHPHRAQPNLQAAEALFTRMHQMRTAVEEAGFKPEAMALTESVLNFWKSHADSTGAIWPTNQSSRWILKRAAAQIGDQWLAAGMALAPTNAALPPALTRLHAEDPQIWVTGWPRLAESLLKHVEHRMVWLVIAMAALVTGCLWLAFRRWSDVVLSFAVMGFSFLVLLAVMGLAGWKWNLMSMTAIPLLLGAGVDYTIHIQSALRRRGGDIRGVRKVTGRAVMLCAATTAFGFGSNAFSSNAGLAALGAVCAAGIAITFASAVLLLPAWWVFFHRNELNAAENPPRSDAHEPSTFYRAWVWNAGHTVVRTLPEALCNWIGRRAASFYGRAHPRRREVVQQNLLPVFDGNKTAAREATRRLYANFGMKIAQLLRCEAGCANGIGGGQWSGWELLSAAISSKRGVLLVTPHLGDWELGGYLLAKRGVRLLVLTQPEPGNGFTELRQQSRARWGIETLVVGQDAFAFVEIIKRLQEGAVVALLLDRPPAPTAVSVELFERPFKASIAAAELARATGCAVLPVYVVHLNRGTEARVLPEIDYDRRALGDRDARRQMTQRIMRAFEPVIKEHADQWYHFVPIWPAKEN